MFDFQYYFVPFVITACCISFPRLISLMFVLNCWEMWFLHANDPYHVSMNHILKFHCLESLTSFFYIQVRNYFKILLYLYPTIIAFMLVCLTTKTGDMRMQVWSLQLQHITAFMIGCNHLSCSLVNCLLVVHFWV